MLDPHSFTTHRFDLWERSGGPSSATDKSLALLQRPPVPTAQPAPASEPSWATEAQSAQPNPWRPASPAPSVHSAPPTGKHVVKAKERVYTVPQKGGPRTLVKTKAAAKRLKNKYITIKESHPEGDICIVLLDRPSEEDSDDEVYPAGANFNIPQNAEHTDQEQLPIPIVTSPPRPTSPASENEVQIWDDRDGPQPPDDMVTGFPLGAPMELDEPQATTAPREPTPTPRASPRRKSWSPRRLSPPSTRRFRSPDWYAHSSSYRPRSPPRGRPYERGRGETYYGRRGMDSYVPTHPTREQASRDHSRSPPRRQRSQGPSSRGALEDRISTHPPSLNFPPRSATPSSISSLSKSSAVPGTTLQDTRHTPPSLLARLDTVTPSLSAARVPDQQPLPSTLALQRQQAAAFLQDCFRQGSSPFASPPFPINGTILPPAPIKVTAGRLIVPPSTELRIRYWWLQDPDIATSTLMQHCLRKGLPFRLVVPEDNLQALRPQGLLPNYNRPSWLDNVDTPIPQDRREAANSRILQEYLHSVTAVLQRPHAHRFLTAGDLLWRIAIAFGPATLYTDALVGPSSTATLYGRRSPPVQGNLVDDLLMPTEITALLGVTTLHQSFWPPLELFRDSQHFNSEWSPANEEWYDRHAKKIWAGDLSTLTPQKQWKTHFRRRGAKDLPALAIVGTTDHAQSSQDTLLSSYPDIWNSYDTIDIARTPSL
jgi:hypothetical protein